MWELLRNTAERRDACRSAMGSCDDRGSETVALTGDAQAKATGVATADHTRYGIFLVLLGEAMLAFILARLVQTGFHRHETLLCRLMEVSLHP